MAKSASRLKVGSIQTCPRCGQDYAEYVSVCPNDGSPLEPPAALAVLAKELADPYEILSLVGIGGMSVVYRGRHKVIDRPVAIKVMHARLVADEVNRKRFEQEAATLRLLNHPNLVAVDDFGITCEGQPYLVLEFVEGASLADLLKDQTQPDAKRIVNLMTQACAGLSHAHSHGIVHRDVKPSNLMVLPGKDGKEIVKVVDFGAVKVLPESGVENQRITHSGDVVGTSFYMSPEQCQGLSVDPRSDVYSLGCVLYESLVGTPPLVGKNSLDTIQKQIYERPAVFRDVVPDHNVNRRLEAIVFRTLEKQPDRRYSSMDELRFELEQFEAEAEKLHEKLLAPADNIARAGKRPMIMMAAFGLLALGAIAVAWHLDVDSTDSAIAQGRKLRQYQKETARALESGELKTAASQLELAVKQAGQMKDTNAQIANLKKLCEVYCGLGDLEKYDTTESRLSALLGSQLSAQWTTDFRLTTYAHASAYCEKRNMLDRAEMLLKLAVDTACIRTGENSDTYRKQVLALARFYAAHSNMEKLEHLLKDKQSQHATSASRG